MPRLTHQRRRYTVPVAGSALTLVTWPWSADAALRQWLQRRDARHLPPKRRLCTVPAAGSAVLLGTRLDGAASVLCQWLVVL